MTVLITTSNFSEKLPDGVTAVLNPYKRKLTAEESQALYRQYRPDGLIAGIEPIGADTLAVAHESGVRAISRCGVGMDNVDLPAARALGIAVCNTPNAPVQSVAELTLAFCFALQRNLLPLHQGVCAGGWKGDAGGLLGGKTVGVIGCGRIGTAVARMALALGCRVVGCDPCPRADAPFAYVALEELLACADIVTLHVAYAPQLHHMIDGRTLSLMKQSAAIVNTARGGLIDENALYAALKEGRIRAAALDCFETEPYAGPLTALPSVILTPHVASSAKEGRAQMEREAADNLMALLQKA